MTAIQRTQSGMQGPSVIGAEITSAEKRREVSGPVLRTFNAIADLWTLNEEQRRAVLGSPPRSTYYGWMAKARAHKSLTLDYDVLIRISLILGIYQALRILYETETDGVGWLRQPNKATVFGGQNPLTLIVGGTQDGLFQLRRYLDAARGGLFIGPNEVDENFRPYEDKDIHWS
ncbi:hypothetical protein GCM10019059_42810 [Camelimonas fluminis]|nr:MbcA/ParS/Xre antitoxin family protein [Camelimonas fluminis]GHE79776.1 hypothetical protein GCM10019059_42810 [Camelimonas fluminis]